MMGLQLEDTEDVTLDDNLVEYARELREGNQRYIMAKLSDDYKQIVADEDRCKDSGKTYDDFLQDLPQDEARLAVVNFDLGGTNKVVFYTWCPEGEADLRKCIILNITKYLLRKEVSPDLHVKAADMCDVEHDEVSEQLTIGRPATAVSGVFTNEDFSQY